MPVLTIKHFQSVVGLNIELTLHPQKPGFISHCKSNWSSLVYIPIIANQSNLRKRFAYKQAFTFHVVIEEADTMLKLCKMPCECYSQMWLCKNNTLDVQHYVSLSREQPFNGVNKSCQDTPHPVMRFKTLP